MDVTFFSFKLFILLLADKFYLNTGIGINWICNFRTSGIKIINPIRPCLLVEQVSADPVTQLGTTTECDV